MACSQKVLRESDPVRVVIVISDIIGYIGISPFESLNVINNGFGYLLTKTLPVSQSTHEYSGSYMDKMPAIFVDSKE